MPANERHGRRKYLSFSLREKARMRGVIHTINAPDDPLTPALSLRERECCVEPRIAAFRRLTVLLGAFEALTR